MSFLGFFGPPNVEKLKQKRDIDGLIKALKYKKDYSIRSEAAGSLGDIGDSRVIAPLIDSLKNDCDWVVRKAAARSLGEIGDTQSIEPLLIASKEDDKKEVSCSAVEALMQIGDGVETEMFDTLIYHWSREVREIVVKLLGQIGDSRATSLLVNRLPVEDVEIIREEIANVVIEIGEPAITHLIALFEKKPYVIQLKQVVRILRNLGPGQGDKEREVWYWIGMNNPHKCVEIGAPAVTPLISVFTDVYNQNIKNTVADALEQIEEAKTLTPLLVACEDEKYWVREESINKLGKMRDTRAIDQIIKRLKIADERIEVHMAAIQALGEIGDFRAVDVLIGVLNDNKMVLRTMFGSVPLGEPKDEKQPLRQAAAEALGKIGDVKAVQPLLFAAQNDRSSRVRDESYKALNILGWSPDQ